MVVSKGPVFRADGNQDTQVDALSVVDFQMRFLWQHERGNAAFSPLLQNKIVQPEDLQRLLSTEMPYGKYKGRKIADLPGNYLNWFAREGFPKGEIGRLLALMQEIDHNGLKSLLDPLRGR